MKNFKHFPLFEQLPNNKLKYWNQFSIFLNITKDIGVKQGLLYLKQLDKTCKDGVKSIIEEVKENGYNQTKRHTHRIKGK